MPIKRKEFKTGKIESELEKEIISFFNENSEEAFEPNEIMDRVNFQTGYSSDLKDALVSNISIHGFITTLDELVKKGKIEKKFIDGKFYYIARELRLASSRDEC